MDEKSQPSVAPCSVLQLMKPPRCETKNYILEQCMHYSLAFLWGRAGWPSFFAALIFTVFVKRGCAHAASTNTDGDHVLKTVLLLLLLVFMLAAAAGGRTRTVLIFSVLPAADRRRTTTTRTSTCAIGHEQSVYYYAIGVSHSRRMCACVRVCVLEHMNQVNSYAVGRKGFHPFISVARARRAAWLLTTNATRFSLPFMSTATSSHTHTHIVHFSVILWKLCG